METKIATWTIIESKIQVMRGLESKVKINNKGMIGLFENICFYDGVFELLLQDKVFLFECLQSIKASRRDMFGQEHFAKGTTSKRRNDIKTREANFTIIGNFIELIRQLLLFTRSPILTLCILYGENPLVVLVFVIHVDFQ